jgi:hypothetical protein
MGTCAFSPSESVCCRFLRHPPHHLREWWGPILPPLKSQNARMSSATKASTHALAGYSA